MALNHVVVLVGGVGGAKLAHGLAQLLDVGKLTVIVNTGDDLWYYGLRVCPDMDTVMYTLAGVVDKVNGWGLANETRSTLDALKHYGEGAWFGVGDRDMATHLLRTEALRNGQPLTAVMQTLTKRLGVPHPILPMTDALVATMIDTVEYGELPFQEYFVRYRWQPTVRNIRFDGAGSATMSAAVEAAICSADAILFGPSNPWLSIAPILAVPGLRALIESRDVPRVALSPIVEGNALKGPAAKVMRELGYEQSAAAVAGYYGATINGFVFDERDAHLRIPTGHATTFNTIMQNDDDRVRLAGQMLRWIESWGQA